MSIQPCESCSRYIDTDYEIIDENGWCEVCNDAEYEKQRRYYSPLYKGEKLAGLLPDNHYNFNR